MVAMLLVVAAFVGGRELIGRGAGPSSPVSAAAIDAAPASPAEGPSTSPAGGRRELATRFVRPRSMQAPAADASTMQQRMFASRPAQMLELRNALTWRLLDEHGAAIEACSAASDTRLVCWHRFEVELVANRLEVASGRPLRCVSDDFAGASMATPRPETLACLAAAIGPLDDVYVDAQVLDGFAAYRGDLDVFFVVPAPSKP